MYPPVCTGTCNYWWIRPEGGGATVFVIVEIQFNVYYIEVPSLKIVYMVLNMWTTMHSL